MTPLIEQAVEWVRSQTAPIAPGQALPEDARLVRRVLSGEDGARLLEVLAKITVLRPSLDPRLSGPASHDFAQRRVGENNVFAALIRLRDLADELERKPDDDHAERQPSVFGWSDADTRGDADAGSQGAEPWRFDPGGAVAGR